ncbi:S8 family serine peptidase [Luteimonas abyssi]|uniref:S8 family serine peptidase n=1 Tax=Luteimonas abyssi TaxID=1247514 RepID=UPI000737CFC0|nr:S8 family serine peptidase [Luteimonas abyssi]
MSGTGTTAGRAVRRSLLAVSIATLLVACGGGGGGNRGETPAPPPEPPPPPAPPPTVVEPPDPAFSRHLELTNAYPALDMGLTGAGVVVGVVDSGVNRDHPSLVGRVNDNLVYLDPNRNDLSVDDKVGHGTAVAQIIAGTPFGAWPGGLAQGAEIVSARIIGDTRPDDDGSGDGNAVDGALGLASVHRDLINRDVRIMNNSWGGLYWDDARATAPIAEEYRPFIVQHGGLVVFAAGNREPGDALALTDMAGLPSQLGPDGTTPAADLERGWLAVVAVDTDRPSELASFSRTCAYAMHYCLAAPGTVIVTGTDDAPDQPDYWQWSGTSFAAPAVSGAAALVWEAFPYFDADLVRQTLLGTATDIGAPGVDEVFGYGLLDVGKAIQGPGRFDWGRVTVRLDNVESVWSNDIAGAGGLTKRGNGLLELAGDNAYRGSTRVEGGTLAVTGTLRASDVIVAPAGTLGGGGRVGGDVINDGTLALDTGEGFAVGGDYTQGASGRLSVTVGHGALEVAGDAQLAGTAHVAGVRQGYRHRGREDILRVDGSLSGRFDQVTYDAARVFFDGIVRYGAQSAWLDIIRLDVLSTATAMGGMSPASLGAAARVEDAFRRIDDQLDGRPGAGAVTDGFIGAAGAFQAIGDVATARAALASLSGEAHALASSAAFDTVDITRRALSTQLTGSLDRPSIGGAWQTRLGEGGEGGFASGRTALQGFLIGQDMRLANGLVAGLAFGETRADSRRDDSGDRGRDRQVQASLYAGQTFGAAHVIGQVGVGRFDRDLRRDLFTGAGWSGVHSAYSGETFNAAVEGGYRVALGADAQLTPYLGAEYTRLASDGFEELGADGFGLRADAWRSSRSQAIAGVRGAWTGAWAARAWTLGGYAEWQQTLSADGLEVAARFVGADAWSPLAGFQPERSGGLFGLGLQTQLGGNAAAGFGYDQRFGPRGSDRMVSLRYVQGF